MNKATATKVLREVQARFGADAALYGADHEELPKGSFSIALEGATVDFWPGRFVTAVPGVFVEPINSCIIGLYDA